MKKTVSHRAVAVGLTIALLCSMIVSLTSIAAEENIAAEGNPWDVSATVKEPDVYDISCMEKMAENRSFALYLHKTTGRFAVENKANGLICYSNPPASQQDERAKNRVKLEMASQLLIRYAKGDNTTPISATSASENQNLKIVPCKDGFVASYVFQEEGFTIPLRVTITQDGLSAELLLDQVKEEGANFLLDVSVLPYLAAPGPEAEGYMLVPDGSGSLIYLNNGKSGKYISYSQKIYGDDLSVWKESASAASAPARLPVFGIKNGDSAVLGILEEGATDAGLRASVSSSSCSYNTVYPVFTLRMTDLYTLGSSSSATVNTIYQKNDFSGRLACVTYRFLYGDQADYSGMALTYRAYLIEKNSLTPAYYRRRTVLELIGGVQVNESFLGVPVDRTLKLTTYAQAQTLVEALVHAGVTDLGVVYYKWAAPNINQTPLTGQLVSGVLGGEKTLRAFLDFCTGNGINDVFLDLDLTTYEKGGVFFSKNKHCAKLLSALPATVRVYSLSTGCENPDAPWSYLASLDFLAKQARSLSGRMEVLGTAGLSLSYDGDRLYTDYVRTSADASRAETLAVYKQIREQLAQGRPVATRGGNAYVVGDSSLVLSTPDGSSGFDIEDETVPFYSLVMDTLLESTFSPINRSSSPSDLLLQTLECGASLQFSLFSSSPYALKNTLYSSWYGSSASDWQQTLCEYDAILRNVYAQIGEASMVHHQKVASNVFETRWSNGKRLLVNYADTAYVMDGQTVPARGWLVI